MTAKFSTVDIQLNRCWQISMLGCGTVSPQGRTAANPLAAFDPSMRFCNAITRKTIVRTTGASIYLHFIDEASSQYKGHTTLLHNDFDQAQVGIAVHVSKRSLTQNLAPLFAYRQCPKGSTYLLDTRIHSLQ